MEINEQGDEGTAEIDRETELEALTSKRMQLRINNLHAGSIDETQENAP